MQEQLLAGKPGLSLQGCFPWRKAGLGEWCQWRAAPPLIVHTACFFAQWEMGLKPSTTYSRELFSFRHRIKLPTLMSSFVVGNLPQDQASHALLLEFPSEQYAADAGSFLQLLFLCTGFSIGVSRSPVL